MPALRRPAPKSTLSAQRASSAPSWGIAAPKVPVSAVASPVPVAKTPSRETVRPAAPTGSLNRVVRKAEVRSATERRVVLVLLMVVVGLVLAVGAMAAESSIAAGRSKERIGGTLGRASLAQMEFRSRNARFAMWDELSQRGMSLSAGLTVVASNASSSHWYLRLRDRTTGVTCDRVGQLLDPPTETIAPNCDNPG